MWSRRSSQSRAPGLSMRDLVSRFCFFHVILLCCINEFKDILIVARKLALCMRSETAFHLKGEWMYHEI
jgi:hypothetical protein